jgi:hypothetical protein
MPKPILHKGGRLLSGPDAFNKQPEIASAMLVVISLWSLLEQHMGMMFATMLHGELGDPLEIYYSFFESGPRKRIFDAMAEPRLSPELRKEVEAFHQSLRSVGKIRNLVAHCTWGWHENYPNCLLLEDDKHTTERMIRTAGKAMRNEILDDEDKDLYAGMKLQRYYLKDFTDNHKVIDGRSRESLRLGMAIGREMMARTWKERVQRELGRPNG